jgi:lauroyl/myristoyl acyltransferase
MPSEGIRPGLSAPPHAPELGWSKRLLGPLHVTSGFWHWLPYHGLALLPQRLLVVPLVVFTAAFWLFLRRIGTAIGMNLEAVLGPASWWRRQGWAFRTFWQFAWCYGERFEHLRDPGKFAVSVDGREHIPAGGFIFVTAHIGLWEMASHLVSTDLHQEVHVVREREIDGGAQQFLEALLRAHSGPAYHTHFATGDPRTAVRLADALRQGGIVALQGDRPRAEGRSFAARLFDRPIPLPAGPAALARATGAPLVPIFSFREGRQRHRIVIREPIPVARTAHRDVDVAAATERLAAHLEWAIRHRPHQWFCFRRLWT